MIGFCSTSGRIGCVLSAYLADAVKICYHIIRYITNHFNFSFTKLSSNSFLVRREDELILLYRTLYLVALPLFLE